jgi:hypothetical protein
VKPLSNLPMV